MLRLTREVRFTIPLDGAADPTLAHVPNGLAGNLSESLGAYCALQVCIEGEIDPASNYVENIKTIDDRVRGLVVPRLESLAIDRRFTWPRAAQVSSEVLQSCWSGLHSVQLQPNPFLSFACVTKELPMTRITQRFEFSAAHRLHNPAISDAQNRDTFGKCNNPEGHGHNYEFEVTLMGEPDTNGHLIDFSSFALKVQSAVIDRFDHKHLNRQTAEFRDTIPSVENIARVIFELLKPQFASQSQSPSQSQSQSPRLHSVKVWETGKTWAEYLA